MKLVVRKRFECSNRVEKHYISISPGFYCFVDIGCTFVIILQVLQEEATSTILSINTNLSYSVKQLGLSC